MDWITFVQDHHIDYVTRGPNTKKGEISIQCPWCGSEDPSQHLGINLTHDAWGCHRNPTHRGKSATYLIRALLGCSQSQALLVVRQYGAADPETLDQALQALSATPEAPEAVVEALVMPPDFRLIKNNENSGRFIRYMHHRGFENPEKVGRIYGLRFCTTGRWKDRIIFPVHQRGKLVAWTGRAISNPINAPRYLSTGDAIKTALFNEDEIFLGGNVLFITEGPMDAIKVDYFCRKYMSSATCVFGTSITIDQISILKQVSKKFKHTVLLLDPEAIETSFNIIEWLPNTIMGRVPDGVEDPGAMNEQQVIKLLLSVL